MGIKRRGKFRMQLAKSTLLFLTLFAQCTWGAEKQMKFMKICQEGNHKAVASFLKEGKININKGYDGGITVLHEACRLGHVEVVKLLMESSQMHLASHLKNMDGRSPLHWACMNGHLEVVKVLFRHADIYLFDCICFTYYWFPLHEASARGYEAIVKFMIGVKRPICIRSKGVLEKSAWDVACQLYTKADQLEKRARIRSLLDNEEKKREWLVNGYMKILGCWFPTVLLGLLYSYL